MADGDYRFVGGLVAFIVIVMAVLVSASAEYPEVAPVPPGSWPPATPTFEVWGGTNATAPGCDAAVFCLNIVAFWLGQIVGVLIGGVIFIAELAWSLVSMFVGFLGFRIPGLPPGLEWVNTLLVVGMLVVLSLFIFRLIRSVIPFVSGE